MELYIGLDWSLDFAVCVFGDSDSFQRARISPSPADVQAFLLRARHLFPHTSAVRVLMEAGCDLWFRLFSAHDDIFVHVVDGKQAKRFVESCHPGGAKDDNRDAHALYLMAKSPEHRGEPRQLESTEVRSLQKLTSIHEHWTKVQTGELQRLRQQLVDTMLPMSSAFSDLKANYVLCFLEKYPTARDVCRLSKAQMERFARKHRLAEGTQELLYAAKTACFDLLTEEESELQAMLIRQLVSRIRSVQASLKEVDAKLESVYEKTKGFESLDSIKGIGIQIGSLLLSQVFNQEGEHPHRDAASIRAGASPLTEQSGEKKAKGRRRRKKKDAQKREQHKLVKMRKSAPARLRGMTYLLGLQITKHHDWAKAQFDALKARGKETGAAYRAVVRSLLRMIQALLRDETCYDRERYVRGLQAKGVEWAMKLPMSE